MIALEHQGARGGLFPGDTTRRGAAHHEVLVQNLTVEFDGDKLGIHDLLAGAVKLRRTPLNHVLLPLTRLL